MKKQTLRLLILLVAVVVMMVVTRLPQYYVSENDVKKGLNFSLPSEIEYVETLFSSRMAYFTVPADVVNDLTKTVEENERYIALDINVLKETEEKMRRDTPLTSHICGEIIWVYMGVEGEDPMHVLFLAQDGEGFYLWYAAG